MTTTKTKEAALSSKRWRGDWCAGVVSARQPAVWGLFEADQDNKAFALDSGTQPPANIFDLASLTKVICTSTLLLQTYVESGLGFDDFFSSKVSEYVPELESTPYEGCTVLEVWEHRGGFKAHEFLFSPARLAKPHKCFYGPENDEELSLVLKQIASLSPVEKEEYSDLGSIVLGAYIVRRNKSGLRDLWTAWKKDHGLKSYPSFGPLKGVTGIIPTDLRHPVGEVNDDNAFSLGSVSSHAGLFSSVIDVWRYMHALMEWVQFEKKIQFFLGRGSKSRLSEKDPSQRFYCGWDTVSADPGTHAGYGADAKKTLGHLGYAGTALWWNVETESAAVLLTNCRVYPEVLDLSKNLIKRLRHEFFGRVWQNDLKMGESWWDKVIQK